jgi:hypothetical protein
LYFIVAVSASCPDTVRAEWFIKSDNQLWESYGPTYKQVNIPTNHTNHGADVGIFRTNMYHSDEWLYGGNYANFGVMKSNGHDPKKDGKIGATQFYGNYLTYLSGNALYGGNIFTVGPIKDIRLDFGFNFNDKNSNLGNKKKEIVMGATFSANAAGTLLVSTHVVKELNYNDIVKVHVNYHPAFQLVIFASQPVFFVKAPLRIQTIAIIETPKGKDGFGRQTVTSFLNETRLVFDLGQIMLNKPKFLDVFIGFQYWLNKSGNDHTVKSGAVEQTALFGTVWHF